MKSLKEYLIEAVTEYDERHRIAQHNAAKPIEHGGLGLHKDNTALERATALGYTTKAYHGTDKEFDNFDIEKSSTGAAFGKGVYVTYNQDSATGWAKNKGNSRIIHLLVNRDNVLKNGDNMTNQDEIKLSNFIGRPFSKYDGLPIMTLERKGDGNLSIGAHKAGFSGIDVPSPVSKDSHHTVFTDLSKVRSIHAAFDPMKKDSGDLLA